MAHRRWISRLKLPNPAQQIAFEEYVQAVDEDGERLGRFEAAIAAQLEHWRWRPVVEALQALRGVSALHAVRIVAELGNFQRFETPRKLMGYLGMIPSEDSSGVVSEARGRKLLSDEHFTVDGTLIEAWASTAKSLRRKDGSGGDGGPDDQGMVNFRGERRSNETHESASDPDAKLRKKARGHETKLSYGGHALMENRHGLCLDIEVRSALEREIDVAKDMLSRQARKHVRPSTLGADKGYHITEFVAHLRKRKIAPHIAEMKGRHIAGLDARTTRHASYAISQQKRKRVEEIFGWMKAYGGLRRTLARGLQRVRVHAYIVATAYNLLRMSRLRPATG